MKCLKCNQTYDEKTHKNCPNCGPTHAKILIEPQDLSPDLRDLEKADGILRMFSRIFLMLSVVGSIATFLFLAHHGGRQVFIALFAAIGILCLGVLIWAVGNVLANISCNLRQLNSRSLSQHE